MEPTEHALVYIKYEIHLTTKNCCPHTWSIFAVYTCMYTVDVIGIKDNVNVSEYTD